MLSPTLGPIGTPPETTSLTETRLAANRPAAPRSCHACNQKKVRCDKREPCSRCARSGKTCSYPAPGPRIRRTKKAMMADMAARLSSLEQSISETAIRDKTQSHGNEIEESGNTTAQQSLPKAPVRIGQLTETHSDGDILVQRGSSSQHYYNDIILSKVIGSEHNIESALTTPRTTSQHPEPPSPYNALGIISSPDPMQSPSAFHPPKLTALRLWEQYVSNEECVSSMKTLHRPTDEAKVFAVINNPAAASYEDLALCYAVYFSAATTPKLSIDHEASKGDRQADLFVYKRGLEQALAYADFLDNPSLVILQALAIYLSAFRHYNRGKGIWIVHALVLRMARSLGLHRDGKQLGLPPFESEIRRRLWWLLAVRDSRALEDYGLKDNSMVLHNTNVEYPSNIEDTDLYPGMRSLPPEREGWTPVTRLIIYIEIDRTMYKVDSMIAQGDADDDARKQLMRGLQEKIEARLAHCNPLIPRQLFTMSSARFVFQKLDFVSRQRFFYLQHPEAHHKFATEENLAAALDLMDQGLFMGRNELLTEYAWAHKAYPQYHMALYVLWHLCLHPETPNTERAWEALDFIFTSVENDESVSHSSGDKSIMLKALRLRAEAARERVRRKNDCAVGAGNGVEQLTTPESEDLGELPLMGAPGDWDAYSFPDFGLQDWTTWTRWS